jgi:hypothetical protein
MKHRWFQYLALGCVIAVGACSNDDDQTALNSPDMKVVTPPYPGCDFGNVKNLINSYFTSPNQLTAQGYEGTMESTTDSLIRRANGFKIMDLIGSVSRGTALSSTAATAGSNLTKALTKCMFDTSKPAYTDLHGGDGLAGVPFDSALTEAAGGAYYVVGAGFPALNSKVLAGGIPSPDPATRLSAVGPGSSSGAVGSWTSILTGNTYEGGTALVYGYKVSVSPIIYEWATIDPSTTFDPYAFISICDGSSDPTLMVHESNVGVLGYSTTNLCGLPDATGTATKYKSNFKNTSVEQVKVDWVTTPKSPLKFNTNYTFTARATTLVEIDGELVAQGVNNTCLSISGTNNNGVGTELQGTTDCGKPAVNVVTARTKTDDALGAGYATFTFKITKSGGISLTLAGQQVVDRSSLITFANPVALKYTVNPR